MNVDVRVTKLDGSADEGYEMVLPVGQLPRAGDHLDLSDRYYGRFIVIVRRISWRRFDSFHRGEETHYPVIEADELPKAGKQ